MTDHLFRQTLVRHMCDDLPTLDEITKAEREDREHLLNCVAVSKGFTDWVDAYHAVRSDARWSALVFPANEDRYDVVYGTAKVRP